MGTVWPHAKAESVRETCWKRLFLWPVTGASGSRLTLEESKGQTEQPSLPSLVLIRFDVESSVGSLRGKFAVGFEKKGK